MFFERVQTPLDTVICNVTPDENFMLIHTFVFEISRWFHPNHPQDIMKRPIRANVLDHQNIFNLYYVPNILEEII